MNESGESIQQAGRAGGVMKPVLGPYVGLALFVVPIILFVLHQPHRVGNPPPLDDPRRVASGQMIYGRYCANCHGANLEGQPNWTSRLPSGRLPAPPHDQSGHTWHHPSGVLFEITKYGLKPPHAPVGYESDMPAFLGTLNDNEIWNVLAFIRSRWPDSVRERQMRLDQQSPK